MRFRLETRYADYDTKGHVNNAVYLTYFEVARVEYYRAFKAWKLGVPMDDPRVQDHLYDEGDGVSTLASSTIN